jgi:hypothetical protein
MHAAIRKYGVSDRDEVLRRVRAEFIPIVRDVPGLVAYYVVDAGDGTLTSITIAEDEAGIQESTTRAADWVRANISSMIESGPEVTVGAVTVDHSRIGATT